MDNVGIPEYLDNLIVDISREFSDSAHLASNCAQARNVFAALDLGEEVFVQQYVYQARQRTKRQAKVGNKMAYFFATLCELCGLKDGEGACDSHTDRYSASASGSGIRGHPKPRMADGGEG